MSSATAVRRQIETALEAKIPSALTPARRAIHPVAPTGIAALDELLQGGFPIGAVTELVGPECSGRTSVALSFLARLTEAGKVCAWIDAADAFDPLSAAAAGLDLERLLWVRCGVAARTSTEVKNSFSVPPQYLVPATATKGLHGGGFGPHPRSEAHGLSTAIRSFLTTDAQQSPNLAPRCAEPSPRMSARQQSFQRAGMPSSAVPPVSRSSKPWPRIEQALRTADLLLQGGGFSAVVLDMGGLAPEFVSRIPLTTWYRCRGAAARTQASILLLTQYACARSSAELVLEFQAAQAIGSEPTVFLGIKPLVQIGRQRFPAATTNVVPLRKPPHRVPAAASWSSRTVWAGSR